MTQVLLASDFVDPAGSLVDSATRLSQAVVELLRAEPVVEIDLHGLRGLTSSFFNVLLVGVRDEHGEAALVSRLRFQFETKAQSLSYRSSLGAVTGTGSR